MPELKPLAALLFFFEFIWGRKVFDLINPSWGFSNPSELFLVLWESQALILSEELMSILLFELSANC